MRGRRLALLALVLGLAAPPAGAAVQRDLAYAGGDDERTLDLYLPGESDGAPPLVVFVHSRFWRADPQHGAADAFAAALAAEGAAVAVVWHRPAPAHRHPAHVEDVAAAVAFLVARADRFGYDPERVFVAGHGAGAHLAALLALDGRHLAAHGLAPASLAGVIAISGVYDLTEDPATAEERAYYEEAFGGAAARRDASPQAHARGDAPPFLVLAAERDVPGYHAAATSFSETLRARGHANAESFGVIGRDHLTILELSDERNAARRHLLAFLGLAPASPRMQDLYAARRYWREPELTTEGFWRASGLVEEHAATPSLHETANRLFATPSRRRWLVRPARYHAVDLFAWLDAQGPERVGSGPFLTLTNARGERAVWRVDGVRPHRPQLVIGLDDERNLFRIVDVYHTLREYSWKGREPSAVTMARPLGAFVFFPEGEPPDLGHEVFGRYALTPESFRRVESDPLAPVRDLPEPLAGFVLEEVACLSCHRFRGVGASAVHLRARDGGRVGGRALPLESYPPEVWRRYVFEQRAVAAEIGATAVPIGPEIAQPLHDLVARESKEAGESRPTRSEP